MTEIRVATRVPETRSEGPGARYALWVQGCSLRCASCCNPEMFAARGGEPWSVEALAREVIAQPGIEGLTLLGGEPMEQAAPLAALATRVRAAGLSVMTFTGFTLRELEAEGDPARLALVAASDLLADGRFVAATPGSRWPWLGSQNQVLHFLGDRYRPDDPRFAAPNTVELRLSKDGLTITGWAPAVQRWERRGKADGGTRSE